MLAMPALWWLRPVRSAARVGEHSAVVWNWLYRSPLLATRSRFGVGIGPPKVLAAPKPVSSVMMSRTFGAPSGAVTPLGKSGLDSLVLRPKTPPNGATGTGRIGDPAVGDFLVDWSCAEAVARRPVEAANQPSKELIASTAAVTRIVRVRIVTPWDRLREVAVNPMHPRVTGSRVPLARHCAEGRQRGLWDLGPMAAFGPSPVAERRLPGAASNSQSRPQADIPLRTQSSHRRNRA